MEAGLLIWIVVAIGMALVLAAVTLGFLNRQEIREMRRENNERWSNTNGRLTLVEQNTSTIVRNLSPGAALQPQFTATAPEPIYPTPEPEAPPRATFVPSSSKRRG